MSGMSSILWISLYREAPSHNESNEKGNGRSGSFRPVKLFPFHSARCERSYDRSGWILSMLLMPLMRSTPGFWMPDLPR